MRIEEFFRLHPELLENIEVVHIDFDAIDAGNGIGIFSSITREDIDREADYWHWKGYFNTKHAREDLGLGGIVPVEEQ